MIVVTVTEILGIVNIAFKCVNVCYKKANKKQTSKQNNF